MHSYATCMHSEAEEFVRVREASMIASGLKSEAAGGQ